MKFNPLYFSIILISVVCAFYFSNFNNGFSTSQGDWGTFGDFIGGVLNPILSFMMIYLLISQYGEARRDIQQQRDDDAIKAFESSFFTFTTIALNEFKTLEFNVDGANYRSSAAVGYVQKIVFPGGEVEVDAGAKFNEVDQRLDDSIYALVASFCVVFKLIEDSCPEEAKDKYINLFSMLLPAKVTFLLCMAEALTKWKILKYPRELGYFNKESVRKVLNHYAVQGGAS